MDPQQQLHEWAVEYGLDGSRIEFDDYSVSGTAMGKTYGMPNKCAVIRLHHKLEGHGCAS